MAYSLDVTNECHVDLEIDGNVGTSMSADNYNKLSNKPSIEGHELVGDSTIQQIGVGTLSVQDIEKILYLD